VGTGSATLTPGSGNTSTATSSALKPAAGNPGWFCFGAYYLGSSNYSASTDTVVTECFDAGYAPSVTTFSPASGKPGTVVTIKGSNLSGVTEVTIDGIQATIKKDTSTKVKVTVAKHTKTGVIVVTNQFGSTSTSTDFIVP
jgi:hypothetical protein